MSAGGLNKRRARMLRPLGGCTRLNDRWEFEGISANADARWLIMHGYAQAVRVSDAKALLLATDAGRAALAMLSVDDERRPA